MPQNQKIIEKPIHCISCGKVIAKGHMKLGSMEITCKCGVKNRIEADTKPEGRVIPQRTTVVSVLTNRLR
jgi:hypothetical protein